ncbi:helix-turn-helix protein [Pseudoalteromonas sp. P1-13-1a]|uniref:helix-turn-helix domain-containing protein n=1 Tax=unclassified Pseudoalteromonas TaxID=194690 RepID=UPI0006D6867E|nr:MULTISPECIES: helix-turn-helix transcriptional regulator [unclassified Pseudoalteromonas]KPZ53136.1 helix-turn-helix protein [Pseudoalteromonas sp. P1-13-1a]KPZ61705.1 helix-turn-helix protein [Pseudoalteromonas sp. P1-7a]
MQALGMELKRLRANKKWTQAFAAREIGIQQSYLSKLENGQFIPSAEVIEKLKLCYGQTCFDKCLPINSTKHTPSNITLIMSLTLFMCGLIAWLCAAYEIFYPQTYFTYQAKLDDFLAFNITQQYQGERFIEGDVTYQIVGERQVSRIENRFIVVGSAVGIVISFVIALLSQRHRFINLKPR